MPSITLKNLPDDLYRRLGTIAKSRRRSLSKELLVALEEHARRVPVDEKAVLDRIRKVRERYRPVMTDKQIRDWKKAGRP
ncbi:MAG: hypothetical protein M0015_07310 [Betaproteobacteria bacterium]|nr:hypothetical protein [Betaproteobacteria bacterium]